MTETYPLMTFPGNCLHYCHLCSVVENVATRPSSSKRSLNCSLHLARCLADICVFVTQKELKKSYRGQLVISTVLGESVSPHSFPVWFVWAGPSSRTGTWPSPDNYNSLIILHWKQVKSFQWGSTTRLLLMLLEKRNFFFSDDELVQNEPEASSGHLCHQEGKLRGWANTGESRTERWTLKVSFEPLILTMLEAWFLEFYAPTD